ncbi:GntR family transcriptional regulator [Micrococcales bacterium 31B]|nr:GntR family transcriptional regulator [Micrococcales bacterium 31B]
MELPIKLDRSSPVPLYFQLAQVIEGAILDGTLAPGARLENETSLTSRLGLSRPTTRQAIKALVDKGLIVRRRGIGTQVVEHRSRPVSRGLQLSSLNDDLVALGQHPRTDLLSYEIGPLTAELAELIGVDEGADFLTLRRLRFADDEPLAYMVNYVPAELAPSEADLKAHGLYESMRAIGVQPQVAHQKIGARPATDAENAMFHEEPGASVLTMERRVYDNSGQFIEFGRLAYRASMYNFETTLVAP